MQSQHDGPPPYQQQQQQQQQQDQYYQQPQQFSSQPPFAGPLHSPTPVQENTTLDSWHPTEDDIIICTQNAFSDTHFKRTENWLNRALEQSRRRRRTAAEARLRYTWLCTTGRTQQRLQDPLVIAQIEQLRFSVQQRMAASAAATAATVAASSQNSPALLPGTPQGGSNHTGFAYPSHGSGPGSVDHYPVRDSSVSNNNSNLMPSQSDPTSYKNDADVPPAAVLF